MSTNLKSVPGQLREVLSVLNGSDKRNEQPFSSYWLGRWKEAIVLAGGAGKAPSKDSFHHDALAVSHRLAEWTEEWLSHGQDTHQLVSQKKDLSDAIQSLLNCWRPKIVWSDSGPSLYTLPDIIPIRSRNFFPDLEAARLFVILVTHPRCARVAKCDRCGVFYYKPSDRDNKRFCTRKCGNAATKQRPSAVTVEKKNLRRVEKALQQWKDRRLKKGQAEDWKLEIHRTTGISLNWLTRRMKSGVIQPPAN